MEEDLRLEKGIILMGGIEGWKRFGGLFLWERGVLSLEAMGFKEVWILGLECEGELEDMLGRVRYGGNIARFGGLEDLKGFSGENYLVIHGGQVFEFGLLKKIVDWIRVQEGMGVGERGLRYGFRGGMIDIVSNFVGYDFLGYEGGGLGVWLDLLEVGCEDMEDLWGEGERWGFYEELGQKRGGEGIGQIGQKEWEVLEKRFIEETLRKESDPLISRTLNRPVSLWVTRFLMGTRVTPNQVSMGTLGIAVLGISSIFFGGSYGFYVLGGILFHLASILDGCDGELARLKFMGTKYGMIIDEGIDDFKNLLLIIALGLKYHEEFQDDLYLWAVWVGGGIYGLVKVFQYWRVFSKGRKDIVEETFSVEGVQDEKVWVGAVNFVSLVGRGDMMAFLVMIFGVLDRYDILFWIFMASILGLLIFLGMKSILEWLRRGLVVKEGKR